MKLSALTSADDVKAEVLKDPSVRTEWDRTAVAQEVALRVVRYRVAHGLSQAELESGDQAPTLPTLVRLAQRLDLEFHIDVTPTNVRLSA